MLPGLRITGTASTTETDIADALDPSRIAARLVAGLAAPIFNGGSLDADRDAAVATARAAVATYAATTLTAWREVEAALAARQAINELNARSRQQGRLELPTCFGLATGEATVGNIGEHSVNVSLQMLVDLYARMGREADAAEYRARLPDGWDPPD